MSAEYLFPNRRTFLAASAGAAVGLTAAARAADEKRPTVGDGAVTFAPVPGWGKLPDGMKYGHGCAVVVDAKDRVIVTSRSASPCVAVFDKEGKLLETWTKEFTDRVGLKGPQEFAATAHGLYWSQEPGG